MTQASDGLRKADQQPVAGVPSLTDGYGGPWDLEPGSVPQ